MVFCRSLVLKTTWSTFWEYVWDMCRASGARLSHASCTQRLRTGLTSAAPPALPERCSGDDGGGGAGSPARLHLFQQGDEMEASAHEQRKRKRVQRHFAGPLGDGEAAFREARFPFLAAQIVVRQTHAMGTVAHPVHELQRLEVEPVFAEMVFDQHEAARDAAGFAQQDGGIVGVVQHVNKKANVEGPVGKRQLGSIERAAAN